MIVDIASEPQELDIGIADPAVLDRVEGGTATVVEEWSDGAAGLVEVAESQGQGTEGHHCDHGRHRRALP